MRHPDGQSPLPLRQARETLTLDAPVDRGRARNLGFLLIIAVYVVTATLYAVWTPTWQNPDEPAHFNYIREIRETRRFPVLERGDYPHQYLEEIKASQFPPEMSIEPIRYEFHQPPLYYLLAAPLFGLSERWPLEAQVLALRLLSVAFGAVLLWVSFRLFSQIFPDHPTAALLATGFAATVPMHVALTAAVNNDTLANLWMAAAVALILGALRAEQARSSAALKHWAWAGVAMGLGMLTKTTAYAAIPVGLIALLAQARRKTSLRALAARALALFGPALALNLPWYVRNVMAYGGADILGLQRHNAIVLGQPTTAEWLARLGWGGVARELVVTTFRSFWAQFGWMGVLIDQRIYQALALFSLVVLLGLLLYLLRVRVNRHLLTPFQWRALGILGLWFLSTTLLYLWYNVQFVQHQGRYLFPALPAIALAVALGFAETLRPSRARLIALLSTLGIAASLALVLLTDRAFKTLSLLLGLAALMYIVVWRLGARRTWAWEAGLYLLLVGLDVVCLFRFIVPYFAG